MDAGTGESLHAFLSEKSLDFRSRDVLDAPFTKRWQQVIFDLLAVIVNGCGLQMRHHGGLPTLLQELAESKGAFRSVFPLINRTKENADSIVSLAFGEFVDKTDDLRSEDSLDCAIRLNHQLFPTVSRRLPLLNKQPV